MCLLLLPLPQQPARSKPVPRPDRPGASGLLGLRRAKGLPLQINAETPRGNKGSRKKVLGAAVRRRVERNIMIIMHCIVEGGVCPTEACPAGRKRAGLFRLKFTLSILGQRYARVVGEVHFLDGPPQVTSIKPKLRQPKKPNAKPTRSILSQWPPSVRPGFRASNRLHPRLPRAAKAIIGRAGENIKALRVWSAQLRRKEVERKGLGRWGRAGPKRKDDERRLLLRAFGFGHSDDWRFGFNSRSCTGASQVQLHRVQGAEASKRSRGLSAASTGCRGELWHENTCRGRAGRRPAVRHEPLRGMGYTKVMMNAKASSDDTAKHKKCINNAKIMQNQSRKKCTENAKTSHQRMPWNAKKTQKNAKKNACVH